MPTIYLISAESGDHVPGHELADPDCPVFAGLMERPDVAEWIDALDYTPDNPDQLVYLATDDDPGMIPAGFDYLTINL